MAALLNFPGNDEIRLRRTLYSNFRDSTLLLSLAPSADLYYPPLKKHRITTHSRMNKASTSKHQLPISMDLLPDECLFEILRRLSRIHERSIAACVSKRWLMLLSTIQASEDMIVHFPDLNYPEQQTSNLSSGSIERCLEAEEVTDVRLAAISICMYGRTKKLEIRGGGPICRATDIGLSAIGIGCPSLRALSIWKLPLITDAGLAAIARGCRMLESLDISHCPLISGKGLVNIAAHCPNLTSLTMDSCSSMGDDGLQAIGHSCSKLLSISIKDCPLVGDKGVSNLVACATSSLSKITLQNVNIGDVSLAAIGHYGRAVSTISLTALRKVSERGFWVMGNALNLVNLESCTINCCQGVTDRGIEAIVKGCQQLKHLRIRKSRNLSDFGLASFTRSARMLERLQLEECDRITLAGVFEYLMNCSAKLRSLALIKCLGIGGIDCRLDELPVCLSLHSLTIRDCPGFSSSSLSAVGKICPNLQQIDLSRLSGLEDAGLLPLLESLESHLVKVNLEGCTSLSDASILALIAAHGSTIKSINLDGCKKITDRSLFAVSANCSALKDLDVSGCSVTDVGIAAIASAKRLNLRTLSLAGCARVTMRSLSFLGKMKESLEGLNLQQCKLINSQVVGSLEEKLWWCEILS